ncbi:MAG: hypothetical protein WC868_10270 [Bacteroidales bacterium]
MSIAIVKIEHQNLSAFKKLVKGLNGKVRILNDWEEEEKQIMLKLIEESDMSEDVPEEEVKKYFQKHGIEL